MPFLFKLETIDGAPAEPPTLSTAVPNWRAGDTIPLGARTLRVVDERNGVRETVSDTDLGQLALRRESGTFFPQTVVAGARRG
jgi:hypothetical protein